MTLGSSSSFAPDFLDEEFSEGEEVDARRAVSTIRVSRVRERRDSEGCFVRGSRRRNISFSAGFVRADSSELTKVPNMSTVAIIGGEAAHPPTMRAKGSTPWL